MTTRASAELTALIVTLRDSGYSWGQLAQKMGISRAACKQRYDRERWLLDRTRRIRAEAALEDRRAELERMHAELRERGAERLKLCDALSADATTIAGQTLIEALRAIQQERDALRAELDEGKGYLTRLLLAIAPACVPFKELPLLATQIDHVYAGQRAELDALRADREIDKGQIANEKRWRKAAEQRECELTSELDALRAALEQVARMKTIKGARQIVQDTLLEASHDHSTE